MHEQLCLSVTIWLTILNYISPCCISGSWMVVPFQVPLCCCDFGWGMNSGWPPRPGCGPQGQRPPYGPGQYSQRPSNWHGQYPQRPPYPSGSGDPYPPGPVFPSGNSFQPVQPGLQQRPGAHEDTQTPGGFPPQQHQQFNPFQPDFPQSPGQQQYHNHHQQQQMQYQRKRSNAKPLKISDSDSIPWNETVPTVRQPGQRDKMPTFLATIATAEDEPVCSGTIISSHFVLSACVRCLHVNKTAVEAKNVHIVVGDAPSRRSHDLQIVVYTVKNVTLHPDCIHNGKYNLKHDIGLVQTNQKIKQSSSIGAAKLPSKTNYQPHVRGNWILAAYSAKTYAASTIEDLVSFVKVSNVEPNTCKQVLNSTFYNETFNYCTPYYHDGRTDNCWDDFGASLSVNNTVFGVLIHKVLCGRPGSAGSFVNVAQNSEWIRKTVNQLSNGTESV